MSLRGAAINGGDVAIPYGFRKNHGIATPVCALVRDDVEHLTTTVNDNLSYSRIPGHLSHRLRKGPAGAFAGRLAPCEQPSAEIGLTGRLI